MAGRYCDSILRPKSAGELGEVSILAEVNTSPQAAKTCCSSGNSPNRVS